MRQALLTELVQLVALVPFVVGAWYAARRRARAAASLTSHFVACRDFPGCRRFDGHPGEHWIAVPRARVEIVPYHARDEGGLS